MGEELYGALHSPHDSLSILAIHAAKTRFGNPAPHDEKSLRPIVGPWISISPRSGEEGRARQKNATRRKKIERRVAFFSSAGVGKFFVILLRLKKKTIFDFQKRDTQWKKHYTSYNEFSSNWGQKSIVCSIFKHMLWKGEIENQSKVACCVVFLRGI